jgi:hypothetical protein
MRAGGRVDRAGGRRREDISVMIEAPTDEKIDEDRFGGRK